MCQSTYRYGKANNKYMKNYDKQIETSYLTYLDANNLHGWARSLKTPVKQKHFIKKKNYNKNNDERSFLEVDNEYPKQLWSSHKDLPFFAETK